MPPSDQPIHTALSGATLSTFKQDYTLPGESGTSVSLICTSADGTVTDISDTATVILFGGIALGVMFFIFAGRVGGRREDETVIGDPDDVIAEMDSLSGGLVAPSARSASNFGTPSPTSSGEGDNDILVEKLEELQKALDSGFITQAEFDQKREQLLNKF